MTASLVWASFYIAIALGVAASTVRAEPQRGTDRDAEWVLHSPDTASPGRPKASRIPWRLVAESDLIVRAVPSASADSIAALKRHAQTYVILSSAVSRAYKGMADRPVQLRYWPPAAYGGPVPEAVAAAIDKEAILFLVHAEKDEDGPYYFAGYDRSALLPVSREREREVLDEVARQAALAARTAEFLAHRKPPLDDRVAALIEGVLQPSTAAEALQGMLSLRADAIPAVTRRMDDRRRLALQSVGVPTQPGAFEGLAHYSPSTVLDLVSLVLQRLAADGMDALPNGGTEQARRRVVSAWRVWLGRALRL
jgi:hypothetical protein